MANINPLPRLIEGVSRLIAYARVASGGIWNRLFACALVVPVCILLMLSMNPVENRLLTQRVHEKNIAILTSQISDLRKVQEQNTAVQDKINKLEQELALKQADYDRITMQIIWGSEDARAYYNLGDMDWDNWFNQINSDDNLMIAAIASAALACLLTVIINGEPNAIFALGAGAAIGMFSVIASKGIKAFLVAGYSQATKLDPYSIMFLAFLAGAYQHRLLDLLIRVVDTQTDRFTLQPKVPKSESQKSQATNTSTKSPGQ
jgi:hypothetical protein